MKLRDAQPDLLNNEIEHAKQLNDFGCLRLNHRDRNSGDFETYGSKTASALLT